MKKKKIISILTLISMLAVTGCTETSSLQTSENVNNTEKEAKNETETEIESEAESETETEEEPTLNTSVEDLEVHFIDIGQGDSILIRCKDQAMMIDFGDNNKGTQVQKYLMDQGIKELKYALGTHPDADHIGGMDVILYKFDVDHVWMPQLESDTVTYRDVVDVCQEEGYEIEQPEWQKEYTLSDATIEIEGPVFIADSYADKNEASIIVKVTYGENSFLFCGDAPVSEEAEMLENDVDLSADVLKLGHHGSDTSTSEAFLQAVSPEYGVISCGEGNSYGHPHASTIEKLKNAGTQIYRTDLQGTVVAYSDGTNITWNQEPTTDYRSGEEVEAGVTAGTVDVTADKKAADAVLEDTDIP